MVKKHITNKVNNILSDANLKEILSKSSLSFILKIMGLGFGYILTLIISNMYGAEILGFFTLSITIIFIFSIMAKLGLDTLLLKIVSKYNYKNKIPIIKDAYLKTLTITLPLGLILSLILYKSANLIATTIFNNQSLTPYLKISALGILPMALLYVNFQSLRGLKKTKEFTFLKEVSPFLLTIVFFALFLTIRTNETPIQSYTLGIFISMILSFILWFKYSNILHTTKQEKYTTKELLATSLPMLLSSSLMLILGWMDTIMLGIFKTEAQVGIYSACIQLSAITSLTLFAINSIAAPKFSELYNNNKIAEFEKIIHQSTKLIFYLSLPVLIILILFANPILGIFGTTFKQGASALIILTIGQFINASSGSVGFILEMTGNEKTFQRIIFGGTIINILLNLLLIPKYGIVGAAIATSLSMAFWNLTSVYIIKKKYNILTIYYPFKK